MEVMDAPAWRKSSYSGSGGGDCTEVATAPGTVLVRDSKNPDGPVLAFGRQAWEAFAAKVKARRFRSLRIANCRMLAAHLAFIVSAFDPV
jgi:Domain of unknown function (DUF397)